MSSIQSCGSDARYGKANNRTTSVARIVEQKHPIVPDETFAHNKVFSESSDEIARKKFQDQEVPGYRCNEGETLLDNQCISISSISGDIVNENTENTKELSVELADMEAPIAIADEKTPEISPEEQQCLVTGGSYKQNACICPAEKLLVKNHCRLIDQLDCESNGKIWKDNLCRTEKQIFCENTRKSYWVFDEKNDGTGFCKADQDQCEEKGSVWVGRTCKTAEQISCEEEGGEFSETGCKSIDEQLCDDAKGRWFRGECLSQSAYTCLSIGKIQIENECKSKEQWDCEKGDKKWENGRCEDTPVSMCSKNSGQWINDTCQCPNEHSWDAGRLKCSADFTPEWDNSSPSFGTFVNDVNGHSNFTCPTDQFLVGENSQYYPLVSWTKWSWQNEGIFWFYLPETVMKNWTDRRYQYKCVNLINRADKKPYIVKNDEKWSREFQDGNFNFTCPSNGFLAGIKSEFRGLDRYFKFLCRRVYWMKDGKRIQIVPNPEDENTKNPVHEKSQTGDFTATEGFLIYDYSMADYDLLNLGFAENLVSFMSESPLKLSDNL